MPHIIIEYSGNLGSESQVQRIVDAVHQAAINSPIVPPDGLRTRAARRDQYRVADGDKRNAFVAVVARLGPGRSPADKHRFLELLLASAEESVSAVAPELDVSYSVELQEIDAEFRINRNHIRTRMQQPAGGNSTDRTGPEGGQQSNEETSDGS